jgi:hypothetical protein
LGVEVVSGDGVGDDEDFPHDSGEGDFSGSIVVVGDAIVEVAHRGGWRIAARAALNKALRTSGRP